MTQLRAESLTVSYGRTAVLHDVSLSVPSGQVTALVGRSGSGKSTFLRVVAGFVRQGSGRVLMDDVDVTTTAPERRRIGYVTQDGDLFPHLDVAANITFGLPRRARHDFGTVGALLELVGLDTRYARRAPHQLSGGEQQRVALARALAPEPRLVLLDEPFSALDADLRASTRRAVFTALAATSTTAVLVTHDRTEALSTAHRVAVLRAGRIVQEGTPVALYRRPADRQLAEFFGDVTELPAEFLGSIATSLLGPVDLGEQARGSGLVLVRPEQIVPHPRQGHAVLGEVAALDFQGQDGLVTLVVQTPTGSLRIHARWPSHLLPDLGDRLPLSVRGVALGVVPLPESAK